MFPRVTHPSAADVLLRPLDLHVLSLPPAFALSQDQTLKLDEILISADHTFSAAIQKTNSLHRHIFDEVHTLIAFASSDVP